MLTGGVRPAHALSQGINLDAASTSQTDIVRAATASNAHGFRIGAIVANASSTNPISSVYGWQFTINYNASAFIPQGDPNPTGLYPDGAFNTILFGAQTTTGTVNWQGLINANNAFGSSTISSAGSNGQITVFITLISPAPAVNIANPTMLANVAFELLPGHQVAAYSFTITNVIFVNSAGGGITGPVPGLGVTETVTDNPPVATIGNVTHLANGDPNACVPTTGVACTAYAYSFDGSASTASSGTIANPGGYFWDFGDGVQDLGVQGPVAVHDYGAFAVVPGKFNVTLRVADTALDTGSARDSLGNVILNVQPSHTQILNFLADLLPTASFTASPTSGNSPLTVNFNAAASTDPDGTIAKYFWSFGDGAFLTTCSGSSGCANVTTASHTYTVTTTTPFTASLVVQDNTGGNSTNTATQVITVSAGGAAPTVTINSLTPNPAVIGQLVTVNFSTTNSPTSVTVNWGDGTSVVSLPGTATTATHTYAISGTFTVTVSATNTAGTGSATASETVNKRATTTTISCTTPVVINQGSTCTVTVTDVSLGTTSTPTGTVSLGETGVTGTFTTCTLSGTTASATCTSTFSASTSGTAAVTATYPGDTSHATSSGTTSIVVNPRATTTTVSCATPVVINQGSACNVTVTDTSPGTFITPTGTVGLSETGVTGSFTTCTLAGTTASATCTSTFTASTSGTAAVTASYPGDTSHAP